MKPHTGHVHKHKWDKIGRQKVGTVRRCTSCGVKQKKRERVNGHFLEEYWSKA